MITSWRLPKIAALVLVLTLPGGAGMAMDQAALKELESLLRELGFDPGNVDGVVDEATIEAIRQYNDFAVRPGEPEPSQSLLDELRGVAGAFAALSAAKREEPEGEALPPQAVPEPKAPPTPTQGAAVPEPEAPEPPAAEPPPVSEPPAKVVVPPPPAPPKLVAEAPAQQQPAQVAELPPNQEVPGDGPSPPSAGEIADMEPLDPAAALQLRIDEELAAYRVQLQYGDLSPVELARRFNDDGRKLLQQAQYEDAILKFSVAVYLDPGFAGAYSNRGTAYQRQQETDLAKQDFEKAKALGFGGLRLRDGSNPLN